jgi:hypothetical protein
MEGRGGTWEHVCVPVSTESSPLVERKRVKEERNSIVQCNVKSDERLGHDLSCVSNVYIAKGRVLKLHNG